MASTLLFRPFYDPYTRSTPTAPWGLLYVAAPVIDQGHDVDIVDEPVTPKYEDHVAEIIQSKKPVCIGISAMTGEQIKFDLRFAKFVRKHTDAPIVWGGIHPTLLPEQTLEHDLVDIVIAGEGEYTYADLVDTLAKGGDPADVAGVYIKKDDEIVGSTPTEYLDLTELPDIPYHLVDVERYIRRRPDLGSERYFEVITSRGCPHPCSFCYIDAVHNKRWRYMPAETVVAKMKDIKKRFDVDHVLFREDNFYVNWHRVDDVAKLMIEENLDLKWSASCRIDYFDRYKPEFLERIKKAGCAHLTFGVESGNDRVLKLAEKNITVEQILRVAEKVNRYGMVGSYHFMGGFPSETEEEFLDTCRLLDAMLDIAPQMVAREIAVFTPYPGLGLFEECVRRGFKRPTSLDEWTDLDWTNPQRDWLTPRQQCLIADAQWLCARLWHPNPAYRRWINRRWKQFIHSKRGLTIYERPAVNFIKRRLQHA
jgi:radical SAM superfamily enzyme YgiQ (UPF0313 family)